MSGNFNAAVYRQRIGELTQRAKHLDRRCTDLTIGESCYLLSLIAAESGENGYPCRRKR